MNKDKYDIYISDVCFVTSLSKEEINLPRRIYSDFEINNRYTHYEEKEKLTFSFKELNNFKDYTDFITECKYQIINENRAFLFHIEMHGSEKGLHLNNNEVIPWRDFYRDLSELNKLSSFNQVINFATCYSFQFLEKNIDWELPSPYQICIYSKEEVPVQEIEDFYTSFYDNFIHNKDFNAAFQSAKNFNKKLRIMSSINLFDALYNKAIYLLIKESELPYFKQFKKYIKNKSFLNHNDIKKIPQLRKEKFEYRQKFLGY